VAVSGAISVRRGAGLAVGDREGRLAAERQRLGDHGIAARQRRRRLAQRALELVDAGALALDLDRHAGAVVQHEAAQAQA